MAEVDGDLLAEELVDLRVEPLVEPGPSRDLALVEPEAGPEEGRPEELAREGVAVLEAAGEDDVDVGLEDRVGDGGPDEAEARSAASSRPRPAAAP